MTLRLFLPVLLTFSAFASAHGLTLHGPVAVSGDRLSHRQVHDGYGCNGANRSPELNWVRVPTGAQSLALTVFDMDAPNGAGWWHWVVYDIPKQARGLPSGAGSADGPTLPPGAKHARNDFGQRVYGGACPPKRHKPHRYVFTLYALDVATLDVPADAGADLIREKIRRHLIAQSSVTATYSR